MLRTYEANFSVALYSLGTYEYNEEEDINYSKIIASHTNNFNWCLCNDVQSNYVLKFLKEGYELFGMADITISDVIYERTGKFTCKIDVFDEIEEPYSDYEIEEIIEESIIPPELIAENGIVINNEKYVVDIKFDYYVETYYDDDEAEKEEEEEDSDNSCDEKEKEKENNKYDEETYKSCDENNYDEEASDYNSE